LARPTNWLFSKGTPLQRCPDCDESLAPDAINVREGVALCPKCGKLSRLSELNCTDRPLEEILSQPPTGCSIVALGRGVVARASFRSLTGFLLPAGLALFWNSIVSIFVLIAIAGLYTNLIGPLPAWFPAPGLKDGKPEMNGEPMGLGMTLFLCVFLIPFVTVGIGMIGVALLNLIGKVEVVIDELDSYVATCAGGFRWIRRFDPYRVRAVSFGTTAWQSEGGPNRLIELSADRTIRFGSLLQADRMEWLRVVLKELLLNPNANRHGSILPYLPWITRQS
jgi:hypothetical protein